MKLSVKIYVCLLNILIISISVNFAEPESEDDDPFYVVANDSIIASNITYYLNTKKNPIFAQRIELGNNASLRNSYFNKSKPVKFIIHGWNGHAHSEMNEMIRDAFLSSHDVNVISPDWGLDAHHDYPKVAPAAPSIGKAMSPFLDWLIEYGVPIKNFHIMGYSLGAHVMSSAVRHVKRGKFPYVTGLDPAKKYWKHSPERLDKLNANYVEVIHTNTNFYGLSIPIGHNDFYPNGGAIMGGAFEDIESHGRAFKYFAESIEKGGFVSQHCQNYEEAFEERCLNDTQLVMGGIAPKLHRGIFHLTTNEWSPYSQSE